MISHTCRGLLFDMDGTILDSFPSANRAWGAWAQSVGVNGFTLEGAVHGRQRPEVIRSVMPDLTEAQVIEAAERVRIAERDDVDGTVPLTGAAILLNALPRDTWGIVTSADREVAVARLKAAGLPIPSVLITADDITVSKPDPAGFLTGAAALGLEPSDIVVLEDAPAGVEAGKLAGMRVIAIRHTQSDDSVFDGVLTIVDNPGQVQVSTSARGLELSLP